MSSDTEQASFSTATDETFFDAVDPDTSVSRPADTSSSAAESRDCATPSPIHENSQCEAESGCDKNTELPVSPPEAAMDPQGDADPPLCEVSGELGNTTLVSEGDSVQILNETYAITPDAPTVVNELPFLDDAIKAIKVSSTTPMIQVQRPPKPKHDAWTCDAPASSSVLPTISIGEQLLNSMFMGGQKTEPDTEATVDGNFLSDVGPMNASLMQFDFATTCKLLGDRENVISTVLPKPEVAELKEEDVESTYEFHGTATNEHADLSVAPHEIGEVIHEKSHEAIFTGEEGPHAKVEFHGHAKGDAGEEAQSAEAEPKREPTVEELLEEYRDKRKPNPPKRILTPEEDAARNKWPRWVTEHYYKF